MPTHSVTNFGTWQFQTLCSHMAVMLRSSCRAIPRATPPSLNPRPTAPCSGTTLGFSYTLATALSPLRAAQGVHFSPVIHLLFLNSSFTGNSHQHDAFTVFSLLPYSPIPLSSDIPPTSSKQSLSLLHICTFKYLYTNN